MEHLQIYLKVLYKNLLLYLTVCYFASGSGSGLEFFNVSYTDEPNRRETESMAEGLREFGKKKDYHNEKLTAATRKFCGWLIPPLLHSTIVFMMLHQRNMKIHQMAHQIGTMFNPQKVILFGSWAWGDPNQDSDVDFCVVAPSRDTRALARKIDNSLFPRLFPLDIVVLTPEQVERRTSMNDCFVTDIMTKGTVLYGQS